MIEASLANEGDFEWVNQNQAHIGVPLEQIESGTVFVSCNGSTIDGFCALIFADGGKCEIDGIFVKPELWGGGIGRALIAYSKNIAKNNAVGSIFAIVNSHAIEFYKKCGFTPAGIADVEFGNALYMSINI